MPSYSLDTKDVFDPSDTTNAIDARLVSRMRLVLAMSVLLAVFINPSGLSSFHRFTWLVFWGYLLHSTVIYFFSELDHPFSQSVLIHRLDVIWFALIIIFTGDVASFFFLFFFFAILTSSFRWGFEEGAKVTVASAAIFMICGLIIDTQNDIARLLLQTTFLLAIGYMSVHWGGSKVRLMHQLVLLREVSRLSNPRFGVDHTITNVLHKTRKFYGASACVLIMQDETSGAYFLRTVREGDASRFMCAEPVDAEAASPLMTHSPDYLIAYSRPRWPAAARLGRHSLAYNCTLQRWGKYDGPSIDTLADLLEARCFISAPLALRKQRGRMYVISGKESFNRADTLFLNHIAIHVFPVIENIEFLDHMASDAATNERQKIALDIHDRTIQPYIGLKLGLGALRNRASPHNPLLTDIDKLMHVAEKVIHDLRDYALTVKTGASKNDPLILLALKQQTAQIKELYGIDIAISVEGNIKVSDRLTIEVVQLVREGVSNICKHTLAQKGLVKVQCTDGWLNIQIENERTGRAPLPFMPKSISDRVTCLGGKVHVVDQGDGNTTVIVQIPV